MKILLAVDGSDYTKKMLAYLSTHDIFLSKANEYTVFTAHAPLPPRVRSAVGSETVTSYYTEEVEKVLDPVCKFLLQHDVNAKNDWKVGAIGETISQFAEAGKFDLIVMGSHGHGALGNLVMGSVTTQVLAHCSVPVLLVR
ncbi:Nucleotide-binding universal stress protein, UspA family [Polaromonas sp. OV174]|uniref:universal stress protein n=1 Tax=Polaromonas sp. OV174 TaxID=1855300 RepID=UPI0008F08C95|nr:universal stress protein [Polaromonas sp. OV174]SFB85733.1 Nucleotide-binding universal stress protein, UspA family [Polaromonas sp. OV174]